MRARHRLDRVGANDEVDLHVLRDGVPLGFPRREGNGARLQAVHTTEVLGSAVRAARAGVDRRARAAAGVAAGVGLRGDVFHLPLLSLLLTSLVCGRLGLDFGLRQHVGQQLLGHDRLLPWDRPSFRARVASPDSGGGGPEFGLEPLGAGLGSSVPFGRAPPSGGDRFLGCLIKARLGVDSGERVKRVVPVRGRQRVRGRQLPLRPVLGALGPSTRPGRRSRLGSGGLGDGPLALSLGGASLLLHLAVLGAGHALALRLLHASETGLGAPAVGRPGGTCCEQIHQRRTTQFGEHLAWVSGKRGQLALLVVGRDGPAKV